MARQLQAVLFDLDDTLIDWSGVRHSWRDIETPGLRRVCDYVGGSADASLDFSAFLHCYLTRTRQAWSDSRSTQVAPHMPQILLDVLAEQGIARDQLDKDAIIAVYGWDAVAGTVVFPDVPPALEALRAQGIKLGIVTNASQPMAMRDAELRSHGLLQYFPDCRFAAADVGYLKPNRRIFEAALARLGSSPEQTVFVGDSPTADIEGALAVGMRAVQRLTGRGNFDAAAGRSSTRWAAGRAYKRDLLDMRRSLTSLAELPAILQAWYPGWRDGSA